MQVDVEVYQTHIVCDICEKERAYDKCDYCKKDVCHKCEVEIKENIVNCDDFVWYKYSCAKCYEQSAETAQQIQTIKKIAQDDCNELLKSIYVDDVTCEVNFTLVKGE